MDSFPARAASPASSSEHVEQSQRRKIVGGLVLTYLFMRLPGLLALPIFGDEAIYLRWAQIVKGEGLTGHQWWVSLADPKPPLHYWLLAAVIRMGGDPLWAGRVLSVLFGAASVPVIVAICEELGFLSRQKDGTASSFRRRLGSGGCDSDDLCPFLGFHQRLATAEALFIFESLLVVWLSLRWGRLSASPASPGTTTWKTTVILGITIGATLMTRQGISYTLCAMPFVGYLMHFERHSSAAARPESSLRPNRFRRPLVQIVTVALLSALLWMPYLLAELRPRALETAGIASDSGIEPTHGQIVDELKRRILYQGNFTQTENRIAMIGHNLEMTLWPQWNDAGEPLSGWLYLYLTPLVFVLCLAGLVSLAATREWRSLGVLIIWLILTLGPVILLGNVTYSRYILAGVPPLLIAAAYPLLQLSNALSKWVETHPVPAWIALLCLWTCTIAWPMKAMASQANRWWEQTLTMRDRYQYVTGWTAGYGTRQAVDYLAGLSSAGPLVLTTDAGWGTPADAAWVYLSRVPNIMLFYTTHSQPILTPGPTPDTSTLRPDKWGTWKDQLVYLPPGLPVLYLTNDPVHTPTADVPADEFLRAANPNLQWVKTFKGVEIRDRHVGEDVALFLVSRPANGTADTQGK